MGSAAPAIISFVATFLVLLPLPWHWRARNIPVASCIIWLAQGNFFRGINAIIWQGNVVCKFLPYGDIVAQLQVASVWGMTASVFCIARHLEAISSPHYSTTGLNNPRNRVIFELWMCVISPVIFAGLHLIVQEHRFNILEDIGPHVSTHWSMVAICIYYLPPVILSLGTSYYGAKALWWFFDRRAEMRSPRPYSSASCSLNLTGSAHPDTYYIRLMGLSAVELLGTLSFNGFVLIANGQEKLWPYLSWNYVHSDFQQVFQIPWSTIPSYWVTVYWVSWSLRPTAAILFWAFFGLGEEAMREHRRNWDWIRVHILRLEPSVYVPRPPPGLVKSGVFDMEGWPAEGNNGNFAMLSFLAKWVLYSAFS
ncbi:fungal pheromone STE3G-protein-coupled receptor [Clavulina sp. PMI_390]|nr:fungal pheromone STE3G-protein-coupled receptor [Clavulina sp. PMI_390]